MAEPQYRFGGPVPERAQWLKKRREWRASSLHPASALITIEAHARRLADQCLSVLEAKRLSSDGSSPMEGPGL